MSTLGLFLPGRSLFHRARAGHKLLLLVIVGAGSVFLDETWQVLVALGLVSVAFCIAGIPFSMAVAQVRPLIWVAGTAAIFHIVLNGWERAVVVLGVLLVLVLLASLVTLTTRTTDLVDALVHACGQLRRLGVDPSRVGLMLALAIRCVPVVIGLAEQVREAQWARGLGASPRAFVVPLVVRSLRHADALGDALVARGLDD